MRPFFSYYGAKWTGAKHYGPPRRDLVIEPFAGSACYSTRWAAPNARLYDKSLDICDLWDFIINCSERDIASLPDSIDTTEDLMSLHRGARLLLGFWVSKGRAEPSNTLSPWYFSYRDSTDCKVWGPAVKRRIINQKPLISEWQVDCLSYEDIPLVEAHWHVDPPYSGQVGRRYPFGDIDFNKLAEWCQSLPGDVDVCENVGADWLPFEPLYSVVSSRGRRDGSKSIEAVWQNSIRVGT